MSGDLHALIGHTGLVGGHLLRQGRFDRLFNSQNIDDIRGGNFGRIVCAGARAEKWRTNQDPQDDRAGIARLTSALAEVRAAHFVLISTVDVFADPTGDEDSEPQRQGLHPYGLHRLDLEAFVAKHFPQVTIVRLPALFGTGLKKNALYDLLHDNQVDRICPLAEYQWYPLDRLSSDIAIAVRNRLFRVHLVTPPLRMDHLVERFFPGRRSHLAGRQAVRYDLRTCHGRLFGGDRRYIMSRDAVWSALEAFVGAA